MHTSVICSFCRAADRHQRVDERSGQSWHPLPGLSHLCHEGSLPRHRWSPCAQRAGGRQPLKQGRSAWNQFQPFFWHLDLKAPVYSKQNWFWLAGKCCQTAVEESDVSKCQQFEVCLFNGVHIIWRSLWADFIWSLRPPLVSIIHPFQTFLDLWLLTYTQNFQQTRFHTRWWTVYVLHQKLYIRVL